MKYSLSQGRLALILAFLSVLLNGCLSPSGGSAPVKQERPSDVPIVPNYAVDPKGLKLERDLTTAYSYILSAQPRSFSVRNGQMSDLVVIVHAVLPEEIARLRRAPAGKITIVGNFLARIGVNADGSFEPAFLQSDERANAFLIYALNRKDLPASGAYSIVVPDPTAIYSVSLSALNEPLTPFEGVFPNEQTLNLYATNKDAQNVSSDVIFRNILTTLSNRPLDDVPIGSPSCNNDSYVLASAILNANSPEARKAERIKVTQAISTLMTQPVEGSHFHVARNLRGYIFAALLVGYRSLAFENYLQDILNNYRAPVGSRNLTLEEVWKYYGNGATGMASLNAITAIHAYLGNRSEVKRLFLEFREVMEGRAPKTLTAWNKLTFQPTGKIRYVINPKGATALCNGRTINVEGLFPVTQGAIQDCTDRIMVTQSQWYMFDELVVYARMLERNGLNAWAVGDKAIFRAGQRLIADFGEPNSIYPQFSPSVLAIDLRYKTKYICNTLKNRQSTLVGAGTGTSFMGLEAQVEKVCGRPLK